MLTTVSFKDFSQVQTVMTWLKFTCGENLSEVSTGFGRNDDH